jgi:hypothetical protein
MYGTEPGGPSRFSIGAERESSLHRALKFEYAGPDGAVETGLEGYVCDGVNGRGEAIEVQTGSFGPLRKKAEDLCKKGKLTIIHPIEIRRYIITCDAEGRPISRRRSPRRGTPWDLFRALVHAPLLPKIAGLAIELALVEVEEERILDGKGSWRRKGASITDRRLLSRQGAVRLESARDYGVFLPFDKDETFTARTLAARAGIRPNLAGKALYVLSRLGLAIRTGKEGRAYIYKTGPGW